jgi:FdhE protein
MMPTAAQLMHRHPEWAPWLALIETVRCSLDGDRWQTNVPSVAGAVGQVPLLVTASLAVEPEPIVRLFEDLRRTAMRAGVAGWERRSVDPVHPTQALAAFRAGLVGDDEQLRRLGRGADVDPGAFATVVALLPVPFLHACRRRWTAVLPSTWAEGYCPCCGAWAAFAEVCGIERKRYLRCGRCAASWEVHFLQCPYCGANDHEALGSLHVGQDERPLAVEVCNRCMGYLKVFHTLEPAPAAEVMLVDLASVELDIVATTREYARPKGLGYSFDAEGLAA